MSDLIQQRHLLILEPDKIAATKSGYLHDDDLFATFIREAIAYHLPETRLLVIEIPHGSPAIWPTEASEWLHIHELSKGEDPLSGEDES